MKITRLKRGHRISLSDGEFEALRHLVSLGGADMEGAADQEAGLSPAGKRAMRGTFYVRGTMNEVEDRR